MDNAWLGEAQRCMRDSGLQSSSLRLDVALQDTRHPPSSAPSLPAEHPSSNHDRGRVLILSSSELVHFWSSLIFKFAAKTDSIVALGSLIIMAAVSAGKSRMDLDVFCMWDA